MQRQQALQQHPAIWRNSALHLTLCIWAKGTLSKRMQPLTVVPDLIESAKAAGLRYVTDAKPGIRRKRSGKGFRYIDSEGKAVRDKDVLARIKSLVIPPAWNEVWICENPKGHLQATGRDAKGRKQSRYHPRWREVRDETKYERMLTFGVALPSSETVEQHLALPDCRARRFWRRLSGSWRRR